MERTNRHLAPLALVAVVVLAGCGGVVGDGTPEPVTPAPVPTTEQPVAPGITADAVDAEQVLDRHEAALAGVSYTTVERLRARYADGETQVIVDTTVETTPDGSLEFVRQEPPVGNITQINQTQIWSDGNRTVYRYTTTLGTTYRSTSVYPVSVDATRSKSIQPVLRNLAVTDAVRLADGTTELTGRLTNTSTVPATRNFQRPRNASITARVGEEGLVWRLVMRYDTAYRGDRIDVRYVLGVENVSSTTVERPPWADV